ncbi:CoA transferase [Rhodococcus sp. IEGM 1241]|uniref:CoA transferase n=1 Tax=Rhodococcus TaxID=1827 RepID=UPI0029534C86|nr:CoA transferase [Rhodococcus sp. IEGM 1241]MDJ0105203.1 CoA transferase [Rhodococcus erythropolis]MDV8015335.1 CoA transferase [Rhodococcus sp. IEGM 1241]
MMRSVTDLGRAMGIPMMAVAVAIADLWQRRTGERQTLSIDLAQAVHAINPLIGNSTLIGGYPPNFGSILTPHQGSVFMGGHMVSPLLTDVFRTRDDRWVLPSAFFPAQRDALLTLLDVPHNKQSIASAISRWDPFELEERANGVGVPLCVVRTRTEFEDHPQGQAILDEPLITIEKIGDSDPEPLPDSLQPLGGLRVLSYTRAIAGPVVGRTLAEHGADVLHVNGPHEFEHDMVWADVGVGMRSARLDLHENAGATAFRSLLGESDVFVQNIRRSKLDSLELGAAQAAALRPGIIYCSLNCYGFTGPWSDRTGFDTQALAFTGYHTGEGTQGAPTGPPTGVLNDFILGYMGTAGILGALARRSTEGGSYHVKLSLSRLSAWYPSLGKIDKAALDFGSASHGLPKPVQFTTQTPLGELRRQIPPVKYSSTPSRWSEPILVPRGSSPAEWRTRAPR